MHGSTEHPTEFAQITAETESFKKKLRALARASLKDFDWPTNERQKQAALDLGQHIESAIDEWIDENCDF